MARTTDQPAKATRRPTTATKSETSGLGSLDEQGQRDRSGENGERHEGLAAVRNENDDRRDDASDNRDELNGRESSNGRLDREVDENRRDEHRDSGKYDETSNNGQQPAIPAAYAPVLDAWKQVFTSWSELTEAMMKAQQDTFASMINGGNFRAKDLGGKRNGERDFAGTRTTASTPDRIDVERR